MSQPTTVNTQTLRIQTAMVLYQLESTLGSFVVESHIDPENLPEQTVQSIKQREGERGRSVDTAVITSLVAATYLDEIFAFALHVSKNRTEYQTLNTLRSLCESLDIFNIRNAISHPNRTFPECYWFRMAAIVTDPAIEKLGFTTVLATFRAALNGQLESPPEDWMTATKWFLPNNLPQTFDHDITGLIGRRKETTEVMKILTRPRNTLVALVGPGGLGKTALVLDILKEISLSPESREWSDSIIFLSLKTEKLTSEGLVQIVSPTTTIEEIKLTIAFELAVMHHHDDILPFEDTIQKYGNLKLLICLDNLETLLRDAPHSFHEFYQTLPTPWRVIVTSRVTVDSGTTVPLGPLSKDGAIALALNYLAKRGGHRLNQDSLTSIVEYCEFNPLAIRLTVDSYVAGRPLPEAISHTKEEILKFSYNNLVEALATEAVEVLECLFVVPEPVTRADICMLLELNSDEVAEAFNQLIRTSLVTRTSTTVEERYELSTSIRDLLLVSPRSQQVRDEVNKRIRQRRRLVGSHEIRQQKQQRTLLDPDYIPDNVPDHAKDVAIRVFYAWRRHDKLLLQQLLDDVRRGLDADPSSSFMHRVYGIIMLELGDRVRGQQVLQKAIELGSGDPASALMLATELRNSQELESATRVTQWLMDGRWDNPENSNDYLAANVCREYWLTRLWLGEYQSVILGTKDWRERGKLVAVLGSLHAAAWRRSVEDEEDINQIVEAFEHTFNTLELLISIEGYSFFIAHEGLKLVEDIVFLVRKRDRQIPEILGKRVTMFVDNHLLSMIDVHRDYELGDSTTIDWLQALQKLSYEKFQNPLRTANWQDYTTISNQVDGFIVVEVIGRPKFDDGNFRPFLFARDGSNKEYFVHKKTYQSQRSDWLRIRHGDKLMVLPESIAQPGKAITVKISRLLT